MDTLEGKYIKLRSLELEDLDFLFKIENNEDFWEISYTQLPYSKHLLKQYIENAKQDIYEARQYRFVIEHKEHKIPIGMIDLFDFVPQHHRAGIGIVITPNYQGKGLAKEAINIIKSYTSKRLNLHQVFVTIADDNINSIKLFKDSNFLKVGTYKDWIYTNGIYKDVSIYQFIF